jgi:chromosome segregation ATPase
MICNFFFVVIEKYIIIDTESINQSRSIMLDKSTLGLNTTMINRFDREKNNYMNVIKDQETQISNLKIQIENFEKKKIEFDNKLSEKDREIEILKNAQRDNNDIKEQLIQDTYTQSELINKLNSKEDEIEELKKQIDLIEKKGKDREKNLNLELYDTKEKLNDFEKLQNEYDKLKIKYKHLKEIYKNNEDSEKLQASLEQRLILTNKENLALKAQLEKITSELMKEKENIKNVELEKKKLEFKISDLGNEIKKLNENTTKKKYK